MGVYVLKIIYYMNEECKEYLWDYNLSKRYLDFYYNYDNVKIYKLL